MNILKTNAKTLLTLVFFALIQFQMSAQKLGKLDYKVFTVKRAGVNRDANMPKVDESLKWVVNTATLIYGVKDAVLIDTFLTTEQSEQLINEIKKTGKNLTTIYITHGHSDHFYGAQLLLDQFPNAKLIATSNVVIDCEKTAKPEVLSYFKSLFPNQVPDKIAVPTAITSTSIDIEGNKLTVVEDGFTDTDHSTSIWVPSIKLLVAGDVVYNGIHPYLAETTQATRNNWIEALKRLKKLNPQHVISGHKNPAFSDNPNTIQETITYLEDFQKFNKESSTPKELFDKMMAKYPTRVNPGSLWGGSVAAKKEKL